MRHRFTIVLLLVAALGQAAVANPAAAHTCAECDPTGCEDGEDHDHSRIDRWSGRTERCQSSSDPDNPAGETCIVVIEVPEEVCDLLDRILDRGTPSLGSLT